MKTGLVLEGGAMRGMYTCGVLDVMLENDLYVDGVVGVSAGAAFGCNYISKQIGRAIRYNKKYCNDKRYVSINSLITTGNLFNTQFVYHDVPTYYDPFDQKTFEENPIPFYVVSTDIETGKAKYVNFGQGDENDIEWIRASSSMPLVSKPVEIEGKQYLDGGIADSIPIAWMLANEYKKNIVILTRPEGYLKKPVNGALTDALMRKYPNLAKASKERASKYNSTLRALEGLEAKGEVLVIRPSKDLHIKRVEKNPGNLEMMYRLGRSDAEKQLNQIREFIKE